MDREAFESAYKQVIGKEASPMVKAQVNKMVFEYTYQQIFNAIWYIYIHKQSVQISSIDTYGIGLLRDAKNMEETLGYFRQLARTRQRAAASAKQSKNNQPEKVIVKRQKQKVYREEYDWDDE